jgi:tetratricopeptide (TPR) repeat protein
MRTHILFSTLTLFAVVGLCAACTQPGQTEIARGNMLASRKDFDGALAAYRAAARAAPGKAHPRELSGHLLFDLGRWSEARAAYEDALRVEPDAALEGRIGLARLDAEEHDLDRAVERLSQVLEQQPNNLYALLSRASVELRRGGAQDPERAIADTARAMAIDQKGGAVLFVRGSSFLAAKRFDEAEAAFRLLERAHPNAPLAWYGYARVASARGDKATALRQLRIAREKARDGSDEWNGGAVLRDPALESLLGDPEFAAAVGAPR